MITQMDRLERGDHCSHVWRHVVQDETKSCGDDADDWQGGRLEEVDEDIHDFKLQVPAI